LIKTAAEEAFNPTPDPPLSLLRASKGKGKARALDPPATLSKGRSALATFTRSKSFAPSTAPTSEDPSAPAARQPFRKVQSLFLPRPDSPAQMAPVSDGSPPKLFVGKCFRVRAEARSASVRTAIESCGGTWVEDEDEEERVDFVIVRLVRYSFTSIPSFLHLLTHDLVVASYILMRQILRSEPGIVLSAGSKVASHANGYALLKSTPPSPRSLTRLISPVSPLAHQDSTLQKICGSSVSLAHWVKAFLRSHFIQCINN
jgi:hypothetical protein